MCGTRSDVVADGGACGGGADGGARGGVVTVDGARGGAAVDGDA